MFAISISYQLYSLGFIFSFCQLSPDFIYIEHYGTAYTMLACC